MAMVNQVQGAVQTVLREGGPLTVDEMIARIPATLLSASKNPKQTVRNALTSDRAIQSAGNSRYVYLPAFVRGASMRLSVDLAAPNRRLLAVGKEVLAILWPDDPWGGRGRSATLRLEGDEAVTVKPEHALSSGAGMWGAMQLPVPFWRWWDKQKRTGADALLVTCEDGEAGRYAVRGIRTEMLDSQALAARNAQLREAAAAVVKAARV